MFEKLICFLARLGCNKINPIKYSKLLRFPAQSLDEKIEDMAYDYLGILTLVSTVMIIAIVFNPWFIILQILFLVIFSVKFIKDILPIKLGRDGEKAMAQYLYTIARQTQDMYVYHDIVNNEDHYNIDHIVVSRNGIFIFDTKTYSKTKGITDTIKIKDNCLYKNTYSINNLPLQVQGQAKWLESELRQKVGVTYKIKPTIAFIGWKIDGENIEINGHKVYITNARNIKSILENKYSKPLFDDAELTRITSAMHTLASNSNKKRHMCCDK